MATLHDISVEINSQFDLPALLNTIIEQAVKGMLPKGPLGRDMFRKLKVYASSEHKHDAQQPKTLDI